MILLADVGASTAKIVYLGSIFSEGKSARIVNKGFNPTYHTEEEICERISRWPIPNGTVHDIHSVIIYGAGCMRLDRAQKVSRSLKIHFSNASIKVYSDLLAPIHANENHKGYYAILGTGSVCCHFDFCSIRWFHHNLVGNRMLHLFCLHDICFVFHTFYLNVETFFQFSTSFCEWLILLAKRPGFRW